MNNNVQKSHESSFVETSNNRYTEFGTSEEEKNSQLRESKDASAKVSNTNGQTTPLGVRDSTQNMTTNIAEVPPAVILES